MKRMHRTRWTSAVALVGAALAIHSTQAHETWLLPESFDPPAGKPLVLRMTSGMGFPDMDSAIDPSRVARATLLQNGKSVDLTADSVGGGALLLEATPQAGPACASVLLHPRVLEIPEFADVEHYLDEVGAPAAVWDAWRATRDTDVWRESYSKLARSFLRGGEDAEAAPCWTASGDTRFDVLPTVDPSDLRSGQTLPLRVLLDGEPLAGQAIGVVREGHSPEPLRHADAYGRVVIDISGPGRHMIYATHLRPADAEGANWESDFVTLTFEVSE